MTTDDPTQPIEQPDATAIEQLVPPEQPPMDDAAGGPQVDATDDTMDEDPDALQVQGGE